MNHALSQKTGRNDPCPCRSGKKYKHCCAAHAPADSAGADVELRHLLESARNHAYRQGNFAAAEQCYRDVLAIKPNNVEALAGVGQGLCWRHRRAAGRQYLVKAAKQMLRRPEKTEGRVLLELAEQLQMWGDLDVALQLARAAVKRMPENPSAQFGLAACLHRLNHADQAIAVLSKVLTLIPQDAGCQILMAILEFDKKQYVEARHRLERVLASETDPKQLARASLELSKVYDKQRDYAAAFAMLSRAGALQAQLPETRQINADYIFNKIALFKQGYDDSLLKRWSAADFADDLPVPVFLIGFLRSGTTLTEQVLAAHPEVLTSDENQLIEEVLAELAAISGIQHNPPEALRHLNIDQARRLRRFYWERVSEEFTQAALQKRFVNKVALNSIETGLISCLFPEAKILFALRDPRDICLSCAMQSFTASPATVNLSSWQGIAKQYAAVMDLWLNLRQQIAPEYLELRYEDVVGDFETSFRRVFALLNVAWDPRVIQYHEKMAGRYVATPSFAAVSQPLYNSAVARWQGYAEYFQPILPVLAPYIEAFGYR
jgi:tetratricopeptide (TPR) repeat protein